MRDYLLTFIIFSTLPVILSRPYIGVMVWSWLSYMNPHRLTWSFAYSFPFAQLVGLVTIVGILFSKEKKSIPWTAITITLLIFIFWMSLTTIFAIFPEYAFAEWIRTIKIQLMTFVTLLLINSKERLIQLIWVIVLSLGFYGVKGGIFTILTGGEYRVWGPEGSFIQGNNEIALALIMTMPLMRFLQLNNENKIVRWLITVSLILTGVTILGTYSRGALVAGLVMLFMLWWRGRQKIIIGVIVLVLLPLLFNFMPESWHYRMNTIETYEEDRSAMGRINVWKFALKLASDHPLFGGGYETFDRSLYSLYLPSIANDPNQYIAADSHSIYFEVLGEHGFIGLFLFLLLGFLTLKESNRIRNNTKTSLEYKWVYDLSSMLQVSIIGFAVGGAFLGLAYFDLYYHLIAMIVILGHITKSKYYGLDRNKES